MYFDRGNTRVVLTPTIDNLATPTLDEIAAGKDITPSLTDRGLRPRNTVQTLDRTPWRSQHRVEVPTLVVPDMELEGYRFADLAADFLWTLCAFRSRQFMVVRLGVPYAIAWAAGQRTETYEVVLGKRTNQGGGAQKFGIQLFVQAFDDDGVVV